MTRLTKLSAAALAAALAVPGLVAADDDATQGSAALDAVSVEAGAGTITVSGASSFGGEAVVVGVDATGDALLPGTDFGNATLTQDPATGAIVAALDLVDGLPEIATAPEGVFFEWNIDVAGGDGVALTAKFIEQSGPGGWYFAVTTFTTDPATGTGNFSSAAVPGEWTGSQLVWNVDPAMLGAAPGDKLVQGGRGPIRSSIGGAGLFTFTLTNFDDMMMDKFVIGGGARVVITDAAGDIVDEGKARVRRDEFTATFEELPAGTYNVEVITEYGDGASSQNFTVTVA